MNRLYYLIATIPNFDPLDGKSNVDVSSTIDAVLDNTFNKDYELVKLLLISNDLRNLTSYFSKSLPSFTLPLLEISPSILTLGDFDDLHQKIDAYPDFLKTLLQDETISFAQLTESEIKKRLWGAYWEALLNTHHPYLTAIVKDNILFQNFTGLSRARMNDDNNWSFWIGFEDLMEDLSSGRQSINGLIQEYPFLNGLPEKIENSPEDTESWYDLLMIKSAETHLGKNPFAIDHLLFIVLKLMILAKWQRRSTENGISRFEFLEKQINMEADPTH